MYEWRHRIVLPVVSFAHRGPVGESRPSAAWPLPAGARLWYAVAAREEIGQSFDRLINKLLHPPIESLRSEAENGPPHGLLDAIKRLFQLKD